MKKHSLTLLGTFALALAAGGSALALNNPLTVDLRVANGAQSAASATIFGSGSTVLVNVTAEKTVPKTAAITLNDGDCAKPGSVAFALSGLSDDRSMTQLAHPLADVAGKAKSMIIHQTSSETSPAFACGKISG